MRACYCSKEGIYRIIRQTKNQRSHTVKETDDPVSCPVHIQTVRLDEMRKSFPHVKRFVRIFFL